MFEEKDTSMEDKPRSQRRESAKIAQTDLHGRTIREHDETVNNCRNATQTYNYIR